MEIIRISPNPSASHPTTPELSEMNLKEDPVQLFLDWYNEAKSYPSIIDANAMHLATTDQNGFPDGRVVLLREIVDRGFAFYTNSLSTKGRALDAHKKAAVTFFWDPLRRQIRIQGTVEQLPKEHTDSYFSKRPRLSQIGAWASKQSAELGSREELEERIRQYEEKFEGKEIPRPDYWNGYRIIPHRFEFWQERGNRLHDRFEYLPQGDGWMTRRLYP